MGQYIIGTDDIEEMEEVVSCIIRSLIRQKNVYPMPRFLS